MDEYGPPDTAAAKICLMAIANMALQQAYDPEHPEEGFMEGYADYWDLANSGLRALGHLPPLPVGGLKEANG